VEVLKDEQDYEAAENDHPIGNLNTCYRCFLLELFHCLHPDRPALTAIIAKGDAPPLPFHDLLAIEPTIRPHANPGDADYESAKDHSGDQCLADPITFPQTKQGSAHGNYAEKL